MAENVVANAGSGGAVFATANGTWSGDASTNFPGCFLAIASGAEGSWTFAQVVGGAGAVSAGVQRMTLASDDPAVTKLNTIVSTGIPITGSVAVTDNSGSLTIDAPVGTPAFVRLSDGTSAITTLPVSLASVPSHAVTNAGAFAVQAAQSGTWNVGDGGGSLTVDAPVATPVFVRLSDGTSAISTLPVSGTVAATQSGTWNVTNAGTFAVQAVCTNAGTFAVQAAQSGTWNVTNVSGTVSLPTGASTETTLSTLNGKVTACNTGAVVLAAGAAAFGKLAANSGVTIGAVEIAAAQTLATVSTVTTVSTLTGGGVAHDGVDSGNPVKIGMRATTSLSAIALVSDADRTDMIAGVDGAQIVRLHANLEDIVNGNISVTNGASTSAIAAQGAGVKICITEIIIANSSATPVTVALQDGVSGTTKMTLMAPAGGGCHKTLNTPLRFTANTAVAAQPSASASTVYITLIGFKSKV